MPTLTHRARKNFRSNDRAIPLKVFHAFCAEVLEERRLLAASLITNGANPQHLFALGDRLIYDQESGPTKGLWATDGTSVGTVELSPNTMINAPPVEAAGLEFFISNGDLWRTDGTPAGTMLVRHFTYLSRNA